MTAQTVTIHPSGVVVVKYLDIDTSLTVCVDLELAQAAAEYHHGGPLRWEHHGMEMTGHDAVGIARYAIWPQPLVCGPSDFPDEVHL